MVLAGTWAIIRLSLERRRHRDLIARAQYEDDLWARGDARGLYGEYPPAQSGRVPELLRKARRPRRQTAAGARHGVGPAHDEKASAAGKEAHTRQHQTAAAAGQEVHPAADQVAATGELEHQLAIRRTEATRARKAADQYRVQTAREADKGRALINEFVGLMRKYQVQPETIYKESRGPHRWTYETIVGRGWLVERHQTAVHAELRYDLYIIPDLGFAKVVDRLPDREMIKALRYNTEPDNSDQAYRAWADRASDLSARAQSHIAKTGERTGRSSQ